MATTDLPVKFCPECKVDKPHLEFYASRNTQDGRATYCKECAKAYQRRWNAANPSVVKRNNDKRLSDPARNRRYKNNMRSWRLNLYGLTPERFEELSSNQGGLCPICCQPPENWADRGFNVDHDHETNEVRGLLCGRCNLGLGYFKDDASRLARAIEYLSNPPARDVLREVSRGND